MTDSTYIGGVNAGQLRSFIERIERLNEEEAAIKQDRREVFAEAKAQGYDVKTMREILKLRRMDKDDRDEQETLLEVYKRALGMEQGDLFRSAPDDSDQGGGSETPHDPETGEIIVYGGDEPQEEHDTASTEADRTYASAAPAETDSTVGLSSEASLASGAGAGDRPSEAAARPTEHDSDFGDPGEIPAFLRRGHPDCKLGQQAAE